ncbi:MAG: NAD(P)/FAD-dependent oxidoreductase [Pseudorhodobacter sp.]|nr:NAD(P)/FAD-dependent oxidoreductase [Rhizobacter sp.]
MAFVDTLLTDTDAQIVMVDRHHRPGGHWNEAYPFVRLHQPAAAYGVNSLELGHGKKDTVGLNAGMYSLSSGAELLAYFDQVMQQRFLPSGRVRFLPMSQVVGAYEVESLLTGARQAVTVRRKVVDGTHSRMQVPSTTPPRYAVASAVRCVPLNELAKLSRPQAGYVVVGAGKTGMDACLWLLEQGVNPDQIQWVMPRDPWVLDRANAQSGDEFFMNTWGTMARQLESVVAAESVQDLMLRLEAAGEWMRIDPGVIPTVYHGALLSKPELAQLRRIHGIVRLGHVKSIDGSQIHLEQGSIPLPSDTLVVDCSAVGIPSVETVPVWSGDRITPQWLRSFGTVFSAALIAHVEATMGDDAEKNALCTPMVPPTLATDWLRMLEVSMKNQQRWSRHPQLQQWLGVWAAEGTSAARRPQRSIFYRLFVP